MTRDSTAVKYPDLACGWNRVYGSRHISGAACCEHRPRGGGSRVTRPAATGKVSLCLASESGDPPRGSASGSPETQEVLAPMSCDDPTGDSQAVALTIPRRHVAFLRETFTIARDGLLGDLAEHSDQLLDPERSRREAATYERLLDALNTRAVVPDYDVRRALRAMAVAIDDSNEYDRVVLEHALFTACSARSKLSRKLT